MSKDNRDPKNPRGPKDPRDVRSPRGMRVVRPAQRNAGPAEAGPDDPLAALMEDGEVTMQEDLAAKLRQIPDEELLEIWAKSQQISLFLQSAVGGYASVRTTAEELVITELLRRQNEALRAEEPAKTTFRGPMASTIDDAWIPARRQGEAGEGRF